MTGRPAHNIACPVTSLDEGGPSDRPNLLLTPRCKCPTIALGWGQLFRVKGRCACFLQPLCIDGPQLMTLCAGDSRCLTYFGPFCGVLRFKLREPQERIECCLGGQRRVWSKHGCGFHEVSFGLYARLRKRNIWPGINIVRGGDLRRVMTDLLY